MASISSLSSAPLQLRSPSAPSAVRVSVNGNRTVVRAQQQADAAVTPEASVAVSSSSSSSSSRRGVLAAVSAAVFSGAFFSRGSDAFALLDDDDDQELLAKVKRERKERIIALKPEGEALQTAVSELRAVGAALDSGDYAAASEAVAGVAITTAENGPVADALTKLSAGSSAKSAVASLRTSIASLQAALSVKDDSSAKEAFVLSAKALQELSAATGLTASIKGL